MPTPVVEDIAAGLKTAVETVTTANGYQFDIGDVSRPRHKDNWNPAHLATLIQQAETDDGDAPLSDGNPPARHWVTTFEVNIVINPDESENRAIDTVRNEVRADVEKAIATAFESGGALVNFQRGFLIGAPARFTVDQGGFDGITVRVAIAYATDENDPYTAR